MTENNKKPSAKKTPAKKPAAKKPAAKKPAAKKKPVAKHVEINDAASSFKNAAGEVSSGSTGATSTLGSFGTHKAKESFLKKFFKSFLN